jgi:hypothetical protein
MVHMEAKELPYPSPHAGGRAKESSAGAVYYVSLATAGNQPWLAVPRTRDVFLSAMRAWHAQRNGRILAVSAMPDVAYVLLELGSLLTVGQVVAGWKAALRHGAGYPQTFRDEFHEYRLGSAEGVEDYGLYMFLTPYRAKLLTVKQRWDGWWVPDPGVFQFPATLNATGGPPEEWVNWPAARFAGLARGNQ